MKKLLLVVLVSVFPVIMMFAQGKKVAANEVEKTLAQGWKTYIFSDYKGAMRNFTAVIDSVPATTTDDKLMSARLKATYGLGLVYNFNDNPDKKKAAELYETVIKEGGKHDEVAWAMLALGRMKHVVGVNEEPDFTAIRAAYQRLIDAFPVHQATEEAIVYLQETYVVSWQKSDALIAEKNLLKYINGYPNPNFLRAAYVCLDRVYRILEKPKERLAANMALLKIVEEDKVNPSVRDLTGQIWVIGDIAEWGLGDFSLARKYYNRLIKEYPLDMRVFAAKIALQRMSDMERRK
ncbi:MAG: tetratricopeptide repeat protein [Spirochaetes bacterium]|nr:tetratricopeptide repeat protein [Spirochaetota bacterium]